MLYLRRHLNMGDYFQSRKSKWNAVKKEESVSASPPQNPLLLFCDLILKYEKYKPRSEESSGAYSPSGSERNTDSYSSESDTCFNDSTYSADEQKNCSEKDDSWDLITCHCMKPFRGRPMIECTLCGTWIHMSCAKVRPNNVPDVFVCAFCRQPKSSKRQAARALIGE